MKYTPKYSPKGDNHTIKPGLFPWITLFTGIVGFAMQCWLLSLSDNRGLLPKNHIAGILSVILLALTLGICFLLLRKTQLPGQYSRQFPKSIVSAICTAFGAIGLGYSGFTHPSVGLLNILLPVISVISALALLAIAFFRAKGMQPNYLLRCAATVCLMLRTVVCCRGWGTEPQLLLYLFPLLASVFLLLATFFHTELDAGTGNYRRYCFFNQAALFCCCLCLPGEETLFYLSAALWMTGDSLGLTAPHRT